MNNVDGGWYCVFCYLELPQDGGEDGSLHTTGGRLLSTAKTNIRLCQTWVYQPRQAGQSIFTRGTLIKNSPLHVACVNF